MNQFSSVDEILNDFKQGQLIILVDNENRENEGDLLVASQFVTEDQINFMATHGRGLICLALTSQQVDQLKLPMMKSEFHESASLDTAFTMSIEAKVGVKTGISCADRLRTIQAATDEHAVPSDLVVPGHIFPLKANDKGVLGRPGHTEAAVDLAILSGLKNKSAVICEIMNEDGTMSRVNDLMIFSKKHNIKIGTIENLIEFRKSLK